MNISTHKKSLTLSIVSPVYEAVAIVPHLVMKIKEAMQPIGIKFEIVLVDDGSQDNSWGAIASACASHAEVRGVKLSRNFGQHYAITAGLEKAKGDVVVLMDCDLQDDPEYISALLDKYYEGNEIVFTKRMKRKHTAIKSLASKLFNLCFTFLSDGRYDIDSGSLTLFSSRVKNEFLKLKEKDRLYIQILKWLGFRSTTIEVDHRRRFSGETSYSFVKLFSLAVQGWTSHSTKLLRMSIYSGAFLAIVALIAAIYIIIMKFINNYQAGWASIIVVILFSTGIIQFSLGILGIYIGKTFEQSKNRPLYIIEEIVNE
ncbi:glycosyl transferase [Cytophagales bacterium WSM2-2]|nr:glycosyl transferase [Cytophagales bacterium WSM2-2]